MAAWLSSALTWKGTHRWGVLAGLLTGTVATFVWRLWFKEHTGIYELLPAFPAAVLAIIIVSVLANRLLRKEP